MKINEYITKMKELNACDEALKDALNYKTSQELWEKCARGDWMLWLIGKMSGEPGSEKRKNLVLTACKCARLSLKYAGEGELRPLKAIETAEAWAKDETGITLKEVRASATDATVAAASATDAAYAAYAAAAYAAYATVAAASATVAAASATTAAAAYARKKTLSECADIVRENYPDVDGLLTT